MALRKVAKNGVFAAFSQFSGLSAPSRSLSRPDASLQMPMNTSQ